MKANSPKFQALFDIVKEKGGEVLGYDPDLLVNVRPAHKDALIAALLERGWHPIKEMMWFYHLDGIIGFSEGVSAPRITQGYTSFRRGLFERWTIDGSKIIIQSWGKARDLPLGAIKHMEIKPNRILGGELITLTFNDGSVRKYSLFFQWQNARDMYLKLAAAGVAVVTP